MTSSERAPEPEPWAQAIARAEQAVRGETSTAVDLDDLRGLLAAAETWSTPEALTRFGYYGALLREAGADVAWRTLRDGAESILDHRTGDPERLADLRLRLGSVFLEAGESEAARRVLTRLLNAPLTSEQAAQTHARLALLAAEAGEWAVAVPDAERARELSAAFKDAAHTDARLRATTVLFQDARRRADTHDARTFVRELEPLCVRLIDHWGEEHPRSVAALATLASARHEIARQDGDEEGMARLTDVLAVAAQRTATMLGARHPQTRAVRETLERAHAATEHAATEHTVNRRGSRSAPEARETPNPRRPPRPPAPDPAEPLHRISLELLVHGVNGPTPESALGDPKVTQVGGDDIAGVYRKVEDVDAESRPEQYQDRPVTEAYSWSPLVTGDRSRALWLILFPFLAVNLAFWMVPTTKGPRYAHRVHRALVRLTALTLTVLLVAAACEVAMDLVAWQCAGSSSCAREQSFWIGFMSADSGGWWSTPGRRLVVASVIPLALTALLWWLSRRTWAAYEGLPPIREDPEYDMADDAGLSDVGFWYGRRQVARLRAAHTAAALLTVAAALTSATERADHGGTAAVTRNALLAAIALCAGAVLVLTLHQRGTRGWSVFRPRAGKALQRAVAAGSLVCLLGAVLHAAAPRPGWISSGALPAARFLTLVPLTQSVLIVGIAFTGWRLHHALPSVATALRGFAPAAVALIGCGTAALMASGASQGAADWLRRTSGDDVHTLPGVPALVTWQVAALPAVLSLLVILYGTSAVRLKLRERQLARTVEHEYPDESPDRIRSSRIASAQARAGSTDGAAVWVVSTAATLWWLFGVLAPFGAWLGGTDPAAVIDDTDALGPAQHIGSWLIAVCFLLLLNSGFRAYRDPSHRSITRVIWDLGTFWPRAAHPFAPPCYAERAVPDLAWHIEAWKHRNPSAAHVVLSGHSQGSILAVAALGQLAPRTRHRVALLTYGSPLARIYGRWFPAYFGPARLRALEHEVLVWRNLWRRTDPIGGPIGIPDPPVDHPPLKDPLSYGRTLAHPLATPIRGNADYEADPEFDRARERLLARITPAGPRPPVHDPPE
ncbi:hypothetical protein [Streptomyces vilmorinianum]|uniref:hypothetical protein n=1 Tax=Streptomyces vilmorinianum TaxID=3051092 RepID=UPI0020C754D5|nr:hypothetical protein [Streptomyces vilmorinianum]